MNTIGVCLAHRFLRIGASSVFWATPYICDTGFISIATNAACCVWVGFDVDAGLSAVIRALSRVGQVDTVWSHLDCLPDVTFKSI